MLDDPPRDNDGKVTPHDHAQIEDQDSIIKRVSKQHLVSLGDGSYRLSTALFSQSSDRYQGSSMNVEKVILHFGHEIELYCRARGQTVAAVAINAGEVRAEAAQVGFEPLEDDPAHGEVWGLRARGKIRKILRNMRVVFSDDNIDPTRS